MQPLWEAAKNERVAGLESELAQAQERIAEMGMEVTIPDLKRRGVQGLCAVSCVRAANEILASRAGAKP